MKALGYLFLTKLKNTIKDLKNHPSKLILYIILLGMIVLVVFTSGMSKTEVEKLRSINELSAMMFALFSFSFITTIMNGFSSGASFFSMADVNNMFLSPIKPKKILIYGLLQQMGTSLLVGFFIFYQYAWIHQSYGISFLGLLAIFFGYCIVMFCAQITSMAIYSYTSNDEKAKKILKGIIIGFFAIIAILIIYKALNTDGSKIDAIVNSIASVWINFIPIIGWIKAVVTGILTNNISIINLVLPIIAVIAYIVFFIYFISNMHTDFYEDVLQATEVSFSAITAKKEGKISDTPKNVKVGKTGINKGFGANAFFYKHMVENRRAGVLLVDKNSLIFIVAVIIFSFFMKDSGSMLPAFFFGTYMQVFSSSFGRWIRELIQPYVYLIPSSPFKKLLNITKENILKIVIEAILIFVVIGIIYQASIPEILTCIIARIGFGILFMAGNILVERLFGSMVNKALILFLYFTTMIILVLPGVLLGVLNMNIITFVSEETVIMLSTFIWNVLISGLIIYLCRDILNYAELNNK